MKYPLLIFVLMVMVALSSSCKTGDERIIQSLSSQNPRDQIIGAFEAGESGKEKFIPLLLKNANNPSSCTHMCFKGFTVYQEKMIALQKILKISPPVKIEAKPDSVVIKFYAHITGKII